MRPLQQRLVVKPIQASGGFYHFRAWIFCGNLQYSYSEEVVSDLLNHLAKSSLKQYQSAWKRFQDWLSEDETEISMPLVAKLLVHCRQRLEARTVLTIRAGLSLPLSEGFGIDFEH